MAERLTARLQELAAALPRDPRSVPMSGCAGGLSDGLWACGATLCPGAAYVLTTLGFDARLSEADTVIGGEERIDSQSFEGKIVGTLVERCTNVGRPLHLVVGRNPLTGEPPAAISSVAEVSATEEMRRVGIALAGFRTR